MSNGSGFPGFPKEDLTQKRETVGSCKTDQCMAGKYRSRNRDAQSVLKSTMGNDGSTKRS